MPNSEDAARADAAAAEGLGAGEHPAYIRAPMLTWMRTEKCLTIREAAGKIGVKPSTWEAWENGVAYPTMEHVWQIQDALRMPRGYLYLSRPPTVRPTRHKRWIKSDKPRALQEAAAEAQAARGEGA